MSDAASTARNPFATRHVRPGALPFLFLDGETASLTVDRLASQQWRGQIVGPHGSGKSTLLATLLAEIESRGMTPIVFRLQEGQRMLPAWPDPEPQPAAQVLVAVDGYEQLSWFSRWRLHKHCQRTGWGLLVTTHEDRSLPTIYRTEPRLETLRTLVERLDPADLDWLEVAELPRLFETHRGDMREVLFALYDLYEQRVRGRVAP